MFYLLDVISPQPTAPCEVGGAFSHFADQETEAHRSWKKKSLESAFIIYPSV